MTDHEHDLSKKEQIERDRSLLETIRLKCDECGRTWLATEVSWHMLRGIVYCDRCYSEEAHS